VESALGREKNVNSAPSFTLGALPPTAALAGELGERRVCEGARRQFLTLRSSVPYSRSPRLRLPKMGFFSRAILDTAGLPFQTVPVGSGGRVLLEELLRRLLRAPKMKRISGLFSKGQRRIKIQRWIAMSCCSGYSRKCLQEPIQQWAPDPRRG
jgi:hypothetical protein